MAEMNTVGIPKDDVVAKAAEKSKLLNTLFDAIKQANDFLSSDELDLAMQSLRLASQEIRQREEAEQRRREASKAEKERAQKEARRQAALERAARIEAEKNRKHVEEVTCMDLPMDWRNSYEDDERAKVHYDSVSDAFMYCLESFGEVDIEFIAFDLIRENDRLGTKMSKLDFLTSNGFNVVQHVAVPAFSESSVLRDAMDSFNPESFSHPTDGVVVEYNDIEYGRSLGATSHHENRLLAFKWRDDLYQTKFRGVEVSTTRTGVVSLTAYFDPVCIDGSMVKRANLFNLGYFEKLELGVGDDISVYRANMIIPQIAENLTRSNTYKLPDTCPSCGEKLIARTTKGGIRELYCPNSECIARNAQKIARFCDKSAMNIKGLSAVMLEKFMENGWIKNYADIYHLADHKDDIEVAPGFGPMVYRNIIDSIEESRVTNLEHFLVAMGIPLMGPQSARTLNVYYGGSWQQMEEDLRNDFDFTQIDGISEMLSMNIRKWYRNPHEEKLWRPVMDEITLTRNYSAVPARRKPGSGNIMDFAGSTVVFTGAVTGMTRKQLTEVLTLMGANVTDSVSGNTDYLIVGANPGGKKLGAAMQHGTRIVTESEFIKMLSSSGQTQVAV